MRFSENTSRQEEGSAASDEIAGEGNVLGAGSARQGDCIEPVHQPEVGRPLEDAVGDALTVRRQRQTQSCGTARGPILQPNGANRSFGSAIDAFGEQLYLVGGEDRSNAVQPLAVQREGVVGQRAPCPAPHPGTNPPLSLLFRPVVFTLSYSLLPTHTLPPPPTPPTPSPPSSLPPDPVRRTRIHWPRHQPGFLDRRLHLG